ncbi:tryptophan 7-halogenase [Natribaculum luteum]|uniref:Tryptophan 7-halogenase n=1 Tax=Natribaculum luteum TaxID=1586232 RepID=A0ABD5NZW0_9EURY|nr:tryptophan 7-halogenase [Natribaculum luteum]
MTATVDGIEDVVIVGGGDVGLATALALRKLNPDLGITVIDDLGADPPEVGKSTYQSILDIVRVYPEGSTTGAA